MSDQVSGPVGWTLIMVGGLVTMLPKVTMILAEERISPVDWIISFSLWVPFLLIGRFIITHEYWWWPTHAEDRIRRIRELVDEPECKDPPRGNA
jgi:hypothetical protein